MAADDAMMVLLDKDQGPLDRSTAGADAQGSYSSGVAILCHSSTTITFLGTAAANALKRRRGVGDGRKIAQNPEGSLYYSILNKPWLLNRPKISAEASVN